MTPATLPEAARWYVEKQQWSIFPLKPQTKVPDTAHGFKDATDDLDQVEARWKEKPARNIGMATGVVLVLDFDHYKPEFGPEAAALLDYLEAEHRTVRADAHGTQLFYAQPKGLPPITNATGNLPAAVDVRGAGGYTVLPPSAHPDGYTYRWAEGRSPIDCDLLPLPDVVADLILERDSRRHRSTPKDGDTTIADFNQQYRIADLLVAHGYTLAAEHGGFTRLSRPGRDAQQSSVVITMIDNVERSYHHSTSDPLHCNGFARDAFDIYTMLEHDGDAKAAYVAAKKVQGKWLEQLHATAPDGGEAYLLKEDRGDLGNAVCVATRHWGKFLYTDSFGWLHFTGTHWDTQTAEAQVHAATVETLKARTIAATKAEYEKLILASTPSAKHTRDTLYHFRYMRTVASSEFDQEAHLLNCANGIVNLRTGDLVAHESSNRFTYCIPVEYDPGAESDLWQNLILDWFPDNHELALYVQRCMGYTVTGATKEECLFYAYGPGRAGKGTLVNTVVELLGTPLARGLKFDALTDGSRDPQNFRLAPLRTVRLVAASESKKAERLDEGLVKQLTGRDQVDAALKHRDSFSFIPQFKLWIMSNHPPRGDVEDAAFWARIRVVAFNKSYLGAEDTGIKDALRRPDNRRGLLAWLVLGAQKWYLTGLRTPPQVFQTVERVRDAQDTVGMWLTECTESNPGAITPLDDVYTSYKVWCEDNGTRYPYTKHILAQRLNARGHVTERRRVGSGRAQLVQGLQVL